MGAKTRTEDVLTVLTTGSTSAIEASFKMDSNNADTHGKPERRCISHRCSVMSAVAMLTD